MKAILLGVFLVVAGQALAYPSLCNSDNSVVYKNPDPEVSHHTTLLYMGTKYILNSMQGIYYSDSDEPHLALEVKDGEFDADANGTLTVYESSSSNKVIDTIELDRYSCK